MIALFRHLYKEAPIDSPLDRICFVNILINISFNKAVQILLTILLKFKRFKCGFLKQTHLGKITSFPMFNLMFLIKLNKCF